MKTITTTSSVIAVASLLAIASQACFSTTPKMIVKSILDVTEVACVLVDDHLEDESALAKACGITEQYLPDVRVLMQAKKQAASRKAALSSPDSSVSDAKSE